MLEETEIVFSGILKFEVFPFTKIQGNNKGLKRSILLMKVITIKKNMEHVIKDTGCFLRYRLAGFDSSILKRDYWGSQWWHYLSALVNKEHQ